MSVRVNENGDQYHRIGVDLPVGLVKDIEIFAGQDQRKRADWIRITLAAAVRQRKAKGQRNDLA